MNVHRPIHVWRASWATVACAMFSAFVAADYDLSWYTIDGGGDMWSTGGGFELSGTIGQPDAGAVMTGSGFALTGGFWALGGGETPQSCIGDLNCDGVVDFGDINPFVLILTNFTAWQEAFPGCPPQNGDIDGSGSVGFEDINPFVALVVQSPIVCQ